MDKVQKPSNPKYVGVICSIFPTLNKTSIQVDYFLESQAPTGIARAHNWEILFSKFFGFSPASHHSAKVPYSLHSPSSYGTYIMGPVEAMIPRDSVSLYNNHNLHKAQNSLFLDDPYSTLNCKKASFGGKWGHILVFCCFFIH
jgi:hypothetical protein